MDFAEPVNRLVEQFKKLPGIGTKSAQRLAFFILKMDQADASELAESLSLNLVGADVRRL